MRPRILTAAIATILLTTPAWAQMTGGTGGAGGGGGGGSGGAASSTAGAGGTGNTISATQGIGGDSLLGSFGTTGGTGGRTTGNTVGSATVSTNNFLAATYVNVLAQGIASATDASGTVGKNVAFGSPVYTITTTTASTGGRAGGTATGRTGGTGSLSTGVSFTQGGSLGPAIGRRGPVIGAVLRFGVPPRPTEDVTGSVQSAIVNASGLANPTGVTVQLIDGAVVLRGNVANDDEKRLAENLAWLSPGVRKVKNELTAR